MTDIQQGTDPYGTPATHAPSGAEPTFIDPADDEDAADSPDNKS